MFYLIFTEMKRNIDGKPREMGAILFSGNWTRAVSEERFLSTLQENKRQFISPGPARSAAGMEGAREGPICCRA